MSISDIGNVIDFGALGESIGSMLDALSLKKTKSDPNHAAIVSAVDNVYRLTSDTHDTLTEYNSVLTKVFERLKNKDFKGQSSMKALEVATFTAKVLKTTEPKLLSQFITALDLIKRDMTLVEKNFTKIFGDLKSADDVKVSHAYVFGYLTMSTKTAEFINRLIYLIDIDGTERPPAYIPMALEQDAPAVAHFVDLVIKRGRRTIMDDLDTTSKKGANLFIQVDGKPLSEYANARDFLPQVASTMVHGLTLNPVMWVVDGLLSLERTRYDRNVKTREWLVTKVSLLELEMSGKDPADPNYRKKREILQAYTKLIAGYDKKIADYEQA